MKTQNQSKFNLTALIVSMLALFILGVYGLATAWDKNGTLDYLSKLPETKLKERDYDLVSSFQEGKYTYKLYRNIASAKNGYRTCGLLIATDLEGNASNVLSCGR